MGAATVKAIGIEIGWTLVAIGFFCAVACIVYAAFWIPWPLNWTDLAKDKPFVEVFALTLTPLGAIGAFAAVFVNARASAKTLQQAVRTERAQRFQKAAEMLGRENEIEAVGGVTLMQQVAYEDLETYSLPAIRTLGAVIHATDRKLKEGMAFFYTPRTTYEGEFGPSHVGSAEALSSALRIARRRWPVGTDALHDGRLFIVNLYLADKAFSHENFSKVFIQRGILNGVRFRECSFEEGYIHAVAINDIHFEECNFEGAELHFLDTALRPISPSHRARLIFTRPVNIRGARINGRDMAEWLAEQAEH